MPLWNRFPNPTRVNHLSRHLSTFLRHWEMMIPSRDRGQIRDGIAQLADNTPIQGVYKHELCRGQTLERQALGADLGNPSTRRVFVCVTLWRDFLGCDGAASPQLGCVATR